MHKPQKSHFTSSTSTLHLVAERGNVTVRPPPGACQETSQDAGPFISSFHELRPRLVRPHPRSNASYPVGLLSQPFVRWHTYEFHWATVVSSHLIPQSQCTQTPKLSTNSSYLHPHQPRQSLSQAVRPSPHIKSCLYDIVKESDNAIVRYGGNS